MVEAQKKKVMKIASPNAPEGAASSNNMSQSSQSAVSNPMEPQEELKQGSQQSPPELDEERVRLDKKRSDKFKFIQDAMARDTIEETNSEYSASFLSNGGGAGDHGGRHRGNSNPHQRGYAYGAGGNANMNDRDALGRNNSTVLEVDEFSESSKHS